MVVLTALSLAGVYIERREKRRFGREELARLLAQLPTASNRKSPEPVQTWPVPIADTDRLCVHLDIIEKSSCRRLRSRLWGWEVWRERVAVGEGVAVFCACLAVVSARSVTLADQAVLQCAGHCALDCRAWARGCLAGAG